MALALPEEPPSSAQRFSLLLAPLWLICFCLSLLKLLLWWSVSQCCSSRCFLRPTSPQLVNRTGPSKLAVRGLRGLSGCRLAFVRLCLLFLPQHSHWGPSGLRVYCLLRSSRPKGTLPFGGSAFCLSAAQHHLVDCTLVAQRSALYIYIYIYMYLYLYYMPVLQCLHQRSV